MDFYGDSRAHMANNQSETVIKSPLGVMSNQANAVDDRGIHSNCKEWKR